MKQVVRNSLTLLSLIISIALWPNVIHAGVAYWDPEGFRGTYSTFTSGSLSGTWENTSWATNASGNPGTTADQGALHPTNFVEGYAAVFAVGAGATNSGTG